MKAKSINEILDELSHISDDEKIEVNLKELLLVYKGIEDWRRFFHNQSHYPTIDDLNSYIGNSERGMYAAMNHIYIKIFDNLLPKDIEDRLE